MRGQPLNRGGKKILETEAESPVCGFLRSTCLPTELGPLGWYIFGQKEILKTICTLGEQERVSAKNGLATVPVGKELETVRLGK